MSDAKFGGSGAGRGLARLLPAVLLIFGIVVHGYQIVFNDEDPQRGSSFAMFATVDVGATRRVIAMAQSENGPIILDMPDSDNDVLAALKDSPSEESARALAIDLSGMEWKVTGNAAVVGEGVHLQPVRVQVVGLVANGRQIVRRVIVDVEIGEDEP